MVRQFLSKLGSLSLQTLYRRGFVPHVLGRLSQYVPGNPGYDNAVSVMEQDWDNLFILDACRADIFEETVGIAQFDEYSRRISQGSHSSEWTRRNFVGATFGDTVYVTGNPHTKLLAGRSFHNIIEVRSEEHDHGPQPTPSEIVESTLAAHAKYPNKRLIVHFMQPHSPIELDQETAIDDLSRAKWLEFYTRSLKNVTATARTLHQRLNGKTIVSADHGETHNRRLFGLFQIRNHPPMVRIPELVEVPWATLTGSRRHIEWGTTRKIEAADDVNERLRGLGYKQSD